ncbi:MAG: YtxH domain-containing protein [Nitrospirae bacterium]|nr:YtxH domain-containing protein [Nitrospirota bacterium]
MNEDYKKIIGAFLIGGAIGAFVALLYAPQSGRETRKDISRTTKRIKRDTVHLVEETVESIDDFMSDMKDKATAIIDQGKELSDNAKKEIVRTLEHGQKAIEKQKNRIVSALGL